MSVLNSPDHQDSSISYQGNWMYLPTLPSKFEEAMNWLLSDPRPSRNQNFDEYKDPYVKRVWRVVKETHKMIDALSLPLADDPQKAKWKVEWLTLEWPNKSTSPDNQEMSEVVDESMEQELFLPPFRYQIHITLTAFDLTEYEFFLTPFHFRLITHFNEALSRKIGDELDGPRPN